MHPFCGIGLAYRTPLNRNQIFNDFSTNFPDPDYLLQCATLKPLNEDVDDINQYA